MKVVHDWLKEYIGDSIPTPEKIEELLTFHAFEIDGSEKVDGHTVIDIDVLPNRSSDCLSHRGIAREIATLTGMELTKDPFREKVQLTPITDKITVAIENPEACMRFGLALMSDITVKDSPDWLKERLEALGQRPINNIVDATNYVMLALGQPLHAYDADKLSNENDAWKFTIRFAHNDEKIEILGGDEYELDLSMQLIVDGGNDSAIGIAGIKGGNHAEVDTDTKRIILEGGHFERAVTRKAAQKLKLQTDASKRFENEISREVIPYALAAAVRLLEDIAGGACEGYVDEYPTHTANSEVAVTLEHINALLGLSLSQAEVEKILSRLGFTHEHTQGLFMVIAPFERTDINIAEDLIEEVGRVYGYEHVESVVPESAVLEEFNTRHYYSEHIRRALTGLGYSEVITSSFREKDEIHLLNALASDKEYLRSSLKENIIEVLDKNMPNADLLGLREIKVFEIGTVFKKCDGGIEEHVSVALGVRTKQRGHDPKDDGQLLTAIEKLEEVLNSTIDRTILEGILEFSLTKLLHELPQPNGYDDYEVSPDIQYKPFSSYPFIARDIALWIDGATTANEVEEVLNETAGDLRVRTTLFDEFKKDERTSYAFRLVFQSNKKTLTDDEVAPIIDRINHVAGEHGWQMR